VSAFLSFVSGTDPSASSSKLTARAPANKLVAAVILGLTWTYPYDYHLWGGWPQGMGVLLLVGLLVSALSWIEHPSVRLALLGGLFAGAIVMTHGTEVYASVLGLAVVGVAWWRKIAIRPLLLQLPLAAALACLITAPYLGTLLGWATGGGASAAGQSIVDSVAANPEMSGRGDWLQLILGASGAGSFIDLPLRVALMVLGVRVRGARLVLGLWAAFAGLLFVVDFVDLPIVQHVFIATYPWLADDRPRQLAVLFASLLSACGLWVCAGYVGRWHTRLEGHPNAWRRLSIACALALFFFAEGSGVSIYKRMVAAVAEQSTYSADDAAAMSWLRQHVGPGEVVANDLSGDAGIWAPYKANVSILLPRSAPGAVLEARQPILKNVLSLNSVPSIETQVCALRVDYLFHGSPPAAFDERLFPDRAALEQAPDLEEVFASGEATVFRIHVGCN